MTPLIERLHRSACKRCGGIKYQREGELTKKGGARFRCETCGRTKYVYGKTLHRVNLFHSDPGADVKRLLGESEIV